MSTSNLWLVDLFCSAGGATKGYQRAGFKVLGVDIREQPNYVGDDFVQADAFAFLDEHGHKFAARHASPECRDHTPLTSVAGTTGTAWQLADIIGILDFFDGPYIVENVAAAKFSHDIVLCGAMFGLRTYRHRKFKLGRFTVPSPAHPKHTVRTATKQRRQRWAEGWNVSVTGDVGVYVGPDALGIDWMTGNELSQAIPPAYTEYVGKHLITQVV